MMPKYLICPGHATSKADGQHHYIGARELMRLYGVDPKLCVIDDVKPWWARASRTKTYEKSLLRLAPRDDGKYSLIGAIDYTRTDRKDASRILGAWLHQGCTVEPRFDSEWAVTIDLCRCGKNEGGA